MRLEDRHFYTGVFEYEGLEANERYECRVGFGKSPRTPVNRRKFPPHSVGAFHTAPPAGSEFGFVFGSCNLHSMNPLSPPKEAFQRISNLVRDRGADFMIHCGDQIYADIPQRPTADLDHFRRKYLDAWDDCKTARKLLTELPHYMILDDHEILNNFVNDLDDPDLQFIKYAAIKVYREFQHIHNPQNYGTAHLHYAFDHVDASFFVMDTRTERYIEDGDSQLIDPEQMRNFKDWLVAGPPDRLKFVVTSVPFVGEVRRPKNDKWCSPPFLAQRGEIIDHIADNNRSNVIFLTGDMHNSYCARMNVTRPNGGTTTIHELMSSPINQLGKSKLGKYTEREHTTPGGLSYSSEIVRFYGGHSNIMWVGVSPGEVRYEIYRTKREREAELSGTVPL